MSVTHLVAVPNSAPSAQGLQGVTIVENGGQRIRMLQQQARELAHQEIDALASDLAALAMRAAEVAESGDAYPTGIRELASRIEEDLIRHMKVIRALMERAARR
jgi:hypothetical protein